MSNLSELLPTGGGQNAVDFVASGTLPNGSPVILKADGTVEAVAETSTSVSESIPAGSEAVFAAANTASLSGSTAVAYDPNTAGKFVVAYVDQDNANYGTAIVGTVSGTSITFGSEVVFNAGAVTAGEAYPLAIAFDPNTANKFVVAYVDAGNSSYGTAIVGTVSGTTVSFGTEVVFNSGSTEFISISFDPNTANTFVIAYRDVGGSYYGKATIGTISGTGLTFGSEYAFTSSTVAYPWVAYDPNTAGKFVVVYLNQDISPYSRVSVGTVSGTTISFGTYTNFQSGSSRFNSIAFDPNTANKFVVAYYDINNSNYGTAIVGTISGTSITVGSEYVFNSAHAYDPIVTFDPNTANKFVITYRDAGNSSYGTAIVGTVSGTSISYGSESVFNSAATNTPSASFDPNTAGKFVVAYKDSDGYGKAIVCQMAAVLITTNLTTTNFIGITAEAISSAATGSVTSTAVLTKFRQV